MKLSEEPAKSNLNTTDSCLVVTKNSTKHWFQAEHSIRHLLLTHLC